MSNIEITTNQTNGIRIWEPIHKDDLVTLVGADVLLAGTILARDSVSLELVLFVKGGSTNENGIPKAVIDYGFTATGAGTFSVRALVGGRIRAADLVIDADGDATNVDAAVLDQLRDFGLVGLSTAQLSTFDNQ
jgi:hypothetical protein